MFKNTTSAAVAAMVLLSLTTTTGCFTGLSTLGYNDLGYATIPIPVSPYFQEMEEDKAWEQERYNRVPILGPITAGGPAVALDPPSEDEIMRALEKARPLEGGLPFLHEVQRNDVDIIIEPIADYIDPPRVYPMIGPARLHHAHYKCIVYFTERTWVGWPLPYSFTDEDAQEVIYIDHNHLHMVGNVDGGPGANY